MPSRIEAPMHVSIMLMVLLCACTPRDFTRMRAEQALTAFFRELSQGDYAKAVRWYGGNYETLIGFSPGIDPNDLAALWQSGCQVNGLQCLTVRSNSFNEMRPQGEYVFAVEFSNPDGGLFVLEACCGAHPTMSPQTQFEYRVAEGEDGRFRVLDMPVYVP